MASGAEQVRSGHGRAERRWAAPRERQVPSKAQPIEQSPWRVPPQVHCSQVRYRHKHIHMHIHVLPCGRPPHATHLQPCLASPCRRAPASPVTLPSRRCAPLPPPPLVGCPEAAPRRRRHGPHGRRTARGHALPPCRHAPRTARRGPPAGSGTGRPGPGPSLAPGPPPARAPCRRRLQGRGAGAPLTGR